MICYIILFKLMLYVYVMTLSMQNLKDIYFEANEASKKFIVNCSLTKYNIFT